MEPGLAELVESQIRDGNLGVMAALWAQGIAMLENPWAEWQENDCV